MSGRLRLLALLAAMLLSLLVRVGTLNRAENIAKDGTVHLLIAHEFGRTPAGEILRSHHYHPAYPAAIAAVAGAFGASWPDGWIAAGQWVSLSFGMLALVCLFFVAGAMFDRGIALITVALVGLSSEFTALSCDVTSDATAAAMILLAVALGLRARRLVQARNRWAAPTAGLSGLAAGTGYLTRPEALLSAVIVLVLLLTLRPPTRRDRMLQLAAAAALVVATVACVLPYAAVIGGLTHKKSLADFALPFEPEPALLRKRVNVLYAPIRVLGRGMGAITPTLGVLLILAWLTWIGAYVFRVRLPKGILVGPSRAGAIAMFAPAAVLLPLLTALEIRRGPEYVSSRHVLMPVLFLAPGAGAGLVILARWTILLAERLGARLRRTAQARGEPARGPGALLAKVLTPRPTLAVCAWTLIVLSALAFAAVPVMHKGKGFYRQAGLDIRNSFGPGRYFLAPNGWTPFFAEAPVEQFTAASARPYYGLQENFPVSPDAILDRAAVVGRGGPYDFLVLDSKLLAEEPYKDLLARLASDGRFQQIGRWPVEQVAPPQSRRGEKQEAIWVFRLVRPGHPQARPQEGARGIGTPQ